MTTEKCWLNLDNPESKKMLAVKNYKTTLSTKMSSHPSEVY